LEIQFDPSRDGTSRRAKPEASSVTVWTSGEAQLEIGNLDTGLTDHVHDDLATADDLAACLDDFQRDPDSHRLTTP